MTAPTADGDGRPDQREDMRRWPRNLLKRAEAQGSESTALMGRRGSAPGRGGRRFPGVPRIGSRLDGSSFEPTLSRPAVSYLARVVCLGILSASRSQSQS